MIAGTIALLLTALACGGGDKPATTVAATPAEIGLEDCDVCGMVAAEQPAPRGQILYHDGTRVFLCSIGDLRAALAAPSPHGKVEHTWVEVLPPDTPVDAIGTAPRPWADPADLFFVAGFDRPLVMGRPALSYATAAAADAAAAATGGFRTTWDQLLAAPINEDPPRPKR